MNRLMRIVSLIALVIAAQGVSAAQDGPEQAILRRAGAASQKSEPEWTFVNYPCDCSLGDEQLGVAMGGWERISDGTRVGVSVYTMTTTEAAASWLDRHAHGEAPVGWTVVSYQMGDDATMSTYADSSGSTQYQMNFRKGRFLVLMGGRSQDLVKRFAPFVLTAISS